MNYKAFVGILVICSLNFCTSGDRVRLQNKPETKKQEFFALLGEMPDRKNISIKELSTNKFEKYKRKLIQYEILGDTIEAYILIPEKIKGKVPGILAIHQDGAHRPYEYGKSEPAGIYGDTALYYGLELCLKGFVVICPDRFGFESRMLSKSRFWKDYKTFPITLNDYGQKIDLTEDLYKGAKASNYLTEGRTMLGVTLAELMFAIDILDTIKEVDNSKIGVIGHSAGGLLAGILMYIDQRINAGCSSCGSFMISDIYSSNYLRPMNGFSGLLTIPGIKKWGDLDDVIAGIYPRPFLELSADIDRSKVFEKAVLIQQKEPDKDVIKQVFYNDGKHTFRKDMREEAYKWLESWLNRRDTQRLWDIN